MTRAKALQVLYCKLQSHSHAPRSVRAHCWKPWEFMYSFMQNEEAVLVEAALERTHLSGNHPNVNPRMENEEKWAKNKKV